MLHFTKEFALKIENGDNSLFTGTIGCLRQQKDWNHPEAIPLSS
jgi:hypothetical protein